MTVKFAVSCLVTTILMTFAAVAAPASFDEALEAWLADNDYEAIPALAEHARTGDTDAQLLLGVIATRPHSPFVLNLPRNDRKTLLRAPGGLSGKSWLKVAADVGILRAQALVAVQTPPFATNAIATLLQLGEDDAAATAMIRASLYRQTDPTIALFDMSFPADMTYVATVLKLSASLDPGRLDWRPGDELLELVGVLAAGAFTSRRPNGGPVRAMSLRLFPGDFRDTDSLTTGDLLVAIAPASRPANRLLTYCTAACPHEVEACAGDAVALLGGYDQIWRFGPPVSALVSEERYLGSSRFHADLARHMKAVMERWPLSVQSKWSEKSCAAASRFRSQFP